MTPRIEAAPVYTLPPLGKQERKPLKATPFSWPDAAMLPPRDWQLGRWLLRGEITVVIAPGGVGKSSLSTGMAMSLASGRTLLGQRVWNGPQGVWSFNLEDDQQELDRQFAAAALHHRISPGSCGDRLYVDSGLDQTLCVATEDATGVRIVEPLFEELLEQVMERGIACIIVDPFVSSHSVDENSNQRIDAVVKRWKRLASEAHISVVLVHHSKKLGGKETTAEDSRGASAVVNAARIALTLNRMSQDEANLFGVVDDQERKRTVRVDNAKANRSPPGDAVWIRLQSVDLGNEVDDRPSDSIGVATQWLPPDVFDGVTLDHLREVQARIAQGSWAANSQASDWAGHVVAEVLDLDLTRAPDMSKAKMLLKSWLTTKPARLVEVKRKAAGRARERPEIVVGEPVEHD